MKFVHIADLHIGKNIGDYSLIEDQIYVLDNVFQFMKKNKVDLLLISGDIYDKKTPPERAVLVFDDFITKCADNNIKIIAISGNHDSSVRLKYGSKLFKNRGIYFYANIEESFQKLSLEDEYGKINFYMQPYIQRGDLLKFSVEKKTYENTFSYVRENTVVDNTERNILLSHQYFINGDVKPDRSESERIIVGGLDAIDIKNIKGFDYVALGHIHSNYKLGDGNIYYSGSILKYSLSEVKHDKGFMYVDMKNKGDIEVNFIKSELLRDIVEIEGYFDEILGLDDNVKDFIHITLLDNKLITRPIERLREKFPYIISLKYKNKRDTAINMEAKNVENISEMDMLKRLYTEVIGFEWNEEIARVADEIMIEVGNKDETY